MKWLALPGGLCLLLVVLGALRGILDPPRFKFIRGFEEATRYPYVVLALLGIGLLMIGFFPNIELRSVDLLGLKADVGRIEKRVDTLSDQMETFFKQRRTEIFDRSHGNWDKVQIVSREPHPEGKDTFIYRVAITLEHEAFVGSVDVWFGINPMTDLTLNGKIVTVNNLIWTEYPEDPIGKNEAFRVVYYPKVPPATSASKQPVTPQ